MSLKVLLHYYPSSPRNTNWIRICHTIQLRLSVHWITLDLRTIAPRLKSPLGRSVQARHTQRCSVSTAASSAKRFDMTSSPYPDPLRDWNMEPSYFVSTDLYDASSQDNYMSTPPYLATDIHAIQAREDASANHVRVGRNEADRSAQCSFPINTPYPLSPCGGTIPYINTQMNVAPTFVGRPFQQASEAFPSTTNAVLRGGWHTGSLAETQPSQPTYHEMLAQNWNIHAPPPVTYQTHLAAVPVVTATMFKPVPSTIPSSSAMQNFDHQTRLDQGTWNGNIPYNSNASNRTPASLASELQYGLASSAKLNSPQDSLIAGHIGDVSIGLAMPSNVQSRDEAILLWSQGPYHVPDRTSRRILAPNPALLQLSRGRARSASRSRCSPSANFPCEHEGCMRAFPSKSDRE